MSTPTQQHWDPITQQYLHYDYSRRGWVYPDGTLYEPTAAAGQSTSRTSQAGYNIAPRSGHDAAAEESLHSHQQSWSPSNYGSSPRSSEYTHDDETDEITRSLASTSLGGSSAHDAGDKTPTQPPVVHYGNVEREPKNEVTDPSLFEKGMVSRGRIRATPGDTEVLDSGFKRQSNPKKFFVPGKIFRILWPEHPGYQTSNVTVITDGKFVDASIITKFRWFVVVKAGSNFCSCLPISTYGRRGVTKPSLQKWQHSVVYSGRDEPDLISGEEAGEGEEGMMRSIRAVAKRKSEKMDPASRIDYSRIYTVDHYVKVKEFGDVHEKDVKRLRKQWWIVFTKNLQEEMEDSDDGDDTEDATVTSEIEPEYLEWVTAKYAYNDPKMMKMQAGDRIGVLEVVTDHWWKGLNLRTNEVNLFPATYTDRTSS